MQVVKSPDAAKLRFLTERKMKQRPEMLLPRELSKLCVVKKPRPPRKKVRLCACVLTLQASEPSLHMQTKALKSSSIDSLREAMFVLEK